LAVASHRNNTRAQREAFDRESCLVHTRLRDRILEYELLLRGGLGLLNSSADITSAQWRAYAGTLRKADAGTGAWGLAYATHVPESRLAAHTRKRQAENPAYAIHPSDRHEAYCPVVFMEPLGPRNAGIIGFDLYSDPVRREALLHARDTGETVLSGKTLLTCLDLEAPKPGCLLYVPVYRPGLPARTVAERRAALRGFVSSPLLVEALVTEALGAQGDRLGVIIHEDAGGGPGTLLHHSPANGPAQFSRTSILDLYDRKWVLTFTWAEESLSAPSRREPLMLVLLGALLAGSMLLIVRSLDLTRLRAEALAHRMSGRLRQSDTYNRAVFQHSSLPIGVTGPEGRFLDANPALLELLGYTREEFIGRSWREITHPDDLKASGEAQRLAQEGRHDSYQLEKRYRHKSGRVIWVLVNVGVSRGLEGQPLLFVGAVKDISADKAAEAALAERRALYQAMFEDNRAVCLLVDPKDGAIKDANHAAAAFYGYTRQELTSGGTGMLNTLPPEELALALAEAGERGGSFNFVHRLKDGSLRDVEVHTGPFRSGGQALLLSTIHDVSDRMRAEAALSESQGRFQALVESMDQGVVLCDAEGRINYANPSFAKLMGESAEELATQHVLSLMTEEEGLRCPERIEARRQGSRQAYETKLVRKDGSVRRVRVMPFPLLHPDGRFRGSCGVVADITAQHAEREAERQRQTRRAALLRLHEMHHATRQELLGFALEQVLAITGSALGYIYAYDEDTKLLTLHSWSPGVQGSCAVPQAKTVYELDQTGLWGDTVRLRRHVLVNDYAAPHPGKRGCPEGHVELKRFLSVPVISMGRVRAVVGVANKQAPYAEEDATQLKLFTDGLWSILERQEAERDLREVTQRFQLAVRAGRIGLWDWNLETGQMHLDLMVEEIFDLANQSRTGTAEDWLRRVHPEERDTVRQSLLDAAAQGGRFEASFRVVLENGQLRHVEASALVQADAQGRPVRMVGVNIDTTSLREAESKLAQSHRFLQSLVDTLPHTFFCKDEKGRYLLVNQAFADMRGSKPLQSYLGRRVEDFETPERAALHREWDQRILAAGPGSTLSYEYTHTGARGRAEHRMVYKSLVRFPDGGAGIVGFNVDNTRRKEAEDALREERRRLSDVIEGTNAGTWEWNIPTGETTYNTRWAEIIGYRLDELAQNAETWRALTHPDDLARANDMLTAHFAGLAPYYDCECRMRHKQGHWVWVHTRGRVFRHGPDGSPLVMSGTHSDISERKLAEEHLALVARFPVENPNPVLRADQTGVLLYANPAAAPLLECWTQKVGGRLPAELRSELRLALESAQARSSERSYVCGIYGFTFSPFVDKGYVNIYAVDITKRKNAETALRLSELRYRELAMMLRLMCDNVPDMIWAKDLEKRYLFANKATCEQYLGVEDPQAALGRTDRHFLERLQAENAQDPAWHTLRLTNANGASAGRYEQSGANRGRFEIYEVRKAPFVNDQGAVIGTVGAARNITVRKAAEDALVRSEERFRTLAQVSPVGIFQADAKGRCTFVNDQWARISGYPKQAALDRNWLRTLRTADRPAILRSFRETARTGNDFVTEFRFRGREDEGRWVLLRAAAERDRQGRFSGFVGAVTDITERRAAEDALRKAKAQAEAATQAKALFLANMSHEIRTPLAGAIGATRLLAHTSLSVEQQRLADMAVESGRALLAVVNDILDFSKIEAGQLKLRPAPFALRDFMEAVSGPFALLAQERGLDFQVRVEAEAPNALVGDEDRLGQVLRNLLSNALKFTQRGSITLAVSQAQRLESAVRLRFSVADTGEGIDPDYLPQIFDSFSQADSSYAKQHGGTGLGLAICKNLVERMGGGMEIASQLGQGATVTASVVLGLVPQPLAGQGGGALGAASGLVQADNAAAAGATPPITPAASMTVTTPLAPAPAITPATQANAPSPGCLRVLLAEDNAIGRVLMEHLLVSAGHTVACVGDGVEVLAALKAQSYDLVLMDVQMPRMDGVAATRQIRQGAAGVKNAGIAVIALTAYVSQEDRQHFLDSGMDDAVAKPTEETALAEAMERAMQASRARNPQNDSPDAKEPWTNQPGTAAQQEGPEPGSEIAPVLDHAYLERSFGEHRDLLQAMLRQFLGVSLPEMERSLALVLREANLVAGRAVAHRARGTLGTIGAARGALVAARAEECALHDDDAAFRQCAQELLHELAAIARHLLQSGLLPPEDEENQHNEDHP